MVVLERCQEAQKTIESVIKELRKNPDVDQIHCNLLENHTNAILELFRMKTGFTTLSLPNIST